MSLEENVVVVEVVAGMEQAEADANLQKAISLLSPFLVKFIHSNPLLTKKSKRDKKPDFSQSLQVIIDNWSTFYPTKSAFFNSKKYFSRAKKVRNLVAHQSFDCNMYQHYMESVAMVATAIGQPKLADIILKLVAVKDDEKENQEKNSEKDKQNELDVPTLKKDEWASLKEKGNKFYKEERWREAMNCYTRAIHLNQEEATLYSNRALCELRLSMFDLAREDIEDAIQLDQNNVKYFRILSDVLIHMEMYKESLEACLQGLGINPRDEVLVIRERDCRALIASNIMDMNPVHGKSALEASLEEKCDKLLKMINHYKGLHLTSEDIEDYHNLDKFMEFLNICTSIAEAHQYEHGIMSATQGSLTKAFDIFEAAAKKGSAEGLYNVATFYSEGKAGLPRDFYKAVELGRKAASQKAFIRFKEKLFPNVGVAEAECFLGDCYRDGRGVDQCRTEAFKWYLKASRHDSPHAQNNLGLFLLNGVGCKMNETSARSWFQKAAEHGLSEAQYNYAMVLEEGRGGPINTIKAGELLRLSADQGGVGALERLQKLSRSGALGTSAMEQTKENLRKLAKKGDPESLYLLGKNYLNGTGGFEKNLRQAERNLKQASKAGFGYAYLPLGKLLLELKKNEEAFEFFKLSAEKGSAEGQFELGNLFAYGHGCVRDEAKARRWLNRAKQQGLSLQLNSSDGEETPNDDWVEYVVDVGRKLFEFETQQQFNSEGMSIQERKKRCITTLTSKCESKNPSATSAYLEFLDAFPAGGRPPPTPIVPHTQRSMKGISTECMNELISRAENGSGTAQSFLNACEMVKEGMDLLMQGQTNDAFKRYRLSQREWDLPITEFSFFYLECVQAAKEALDRNSQDADSLYVLARMGTQSNEDKLEMAKRCVELDPSVPDFHHFLGCMCGFVNDYKNGFRATERAIEMLPNQQGWLYDRATHVKLKECEEKNKFGDDTVEAYLKFISSNHRDHRKFPEACYCLAHIYAHSNEITKAKEYYQKGLEAEDYKIRLPCFNPVEDDFPPKMLARLLLKAREGKKMPLEKNSNVATSTSLQEKSSNHCAYCLKSNQSLRCIACKSVWYCDRTCQVAHWKKHKVDCKRLYPQN